MVDIAEVGAPLRGRQCFMMPISYQTVSIQGTPEEIYAEARRLYDLLAHATRAASSATSRNTADGHVGGELPACGEAFRRLLPPSN